MLCFLLNRIFCLTCHYEDYGDVVDDDVGDNSVSRILVMMVVLVAVVDDGMEWYGIVKMKMTMTMMMIV